MNTAIRRTVFVSAVAFACFASLGAKLRDDGVAFPEGYRGWTHISTMVVSASARGPAMHHLYANSKAVEGYRTGRFPDGAIIVSDQFSLAVNGAVTKVGERQVVDVMVRDSARFRDTGGWGWDEFAGDSKTNHSFDQSKAVTACFNCHMQKKDQNYVFTSFRDSDRAPH